MKINPDTPIMDDKCLICRKRVTGEDFVPWKADRGPDGVFTVIYEVMHKSCWLTTDLKELRDILYNNPLNPNSPLNRGEVKLARDIDEEVRKLTCSCGNSSFFRTIENTESGSKNECLKCGSIITILKVKNQT